MSKVASVYAVGTVALNASDTADDNDNDSVALASVRIGVSEKDQYIIAFPKYNSTIFSVWFIEKVKEHMDGNTLFVVFLIIIGFGTPIIWSLENGLASNIFYGCSILGLLAPLNMLSSRNARILKWNLRRFDFIFASLNVLFWVILQSFEFGWDARILPLWLSYLPTMLIGLTTDSTTSTFEFNCKKMLCGLSLILALFVFVLSAGGLFQPLMNYKVFCSMQQASCTAEHNIDFPSTNVSNTTNTHQGWAGSSWSHARHDRWQMDFVIHVVQILDARLLTIVLWYTKLLLQAFKHPGQCLLIDYHASKEIVDLEHQALEDEILGSKESAKIVDLGHSKLVLDEASVEAIADLGPDEEVEVYSPSRDNMKTYVVGPEATIGYYLMLCDVDRTAKVASWMENHRIWGQVVMFGSFPITILGAMEVLPHWCVWLFMLAILDGIRCLFKLNIAVAKRILQEFDVVFLLICIFAVFLLANISFGFDGAFISFFFTFCFVFVTNCLLDDADLESRCIIDGSSPGFYIIFGCASLLFAAGLITGSFPQGVNVLMPFRFLKADIEIGSATSLSRALAFCVLFLAKFSAKAWLHPEQCTVLKVGAVKRTLKKKDLSTFINISNRRRTIVGSQRSFKVKNQSFNAARDCSREGKISSKITPIP